MDLLRQLFAGQLVEADSLGRERSGRGESFGEEEDLCNLDVIWNNHRHRTEEELQVVWQFHSTGVA